MAKYQQLFSDAQRQQALADSLTQRAMQPRVPQQQGRIASAYSIGEGLGQLGEALIARRAGKKATSMTAAADEARRQEQAAALAGMSGQPEVGEGPPAPVNPYARGQEALEAGVDQNVVAAYMKQHAPNPNESPFGVVDPSRFTPESMAKFAQTKNYGDLVPHNNMYGRYNPGDYTPASWAEFQQTNDPAKLVRFAQNQIRATSGGGIVAVDPLNPTAPQTVVSDQAGTQSAADKAGAEAKARAVAEAEGKALGAYMAKAATAQGVQEILEMAEPIIDVATGSATGAIRDKVASWFGVSTEGAQGVAQLAPLQAALMMSQPRMEGPQSDKDTQLYREAAGQIGDPNIPAETKKAAVRTILALNQKYQSRGYVPGQTPIIPNSAPPQGQPQSAPAQTSGAVSWNDL